MRPFKFFFGISVALILFFFLARVVLVALFFAAVMSLIFFVLRGIKNFFQYMSWEDYRYRYQDYDRFNPKGLSKWDRESGLMLEDLDRSYDYRTRERIIEVL